VTNKEGHNLHSLKNDALSHNEISPNIASTQATWLLYKNNEFENINISLNITVIKIITKKILTIFLNSL